MNTLLSGKHPKTYLESKMKRDKKRMNTERHSLVQMAKKVSLLILPKSKMMTINKSKK